MQKFDIDHLHKVIDKIDQGIPIGRREGQTTAYVVRMAGEIELGDNGNIYAYITNTINESRRVMGELEDYIKLNMPENYVLVSQNEDRLESNGKIFIFSSPAFADRFRGYLLSDVYLDLIPEVRLHPAELDNIRMLQSRIKSQNEF